MCTASADGLALVGLQVRQATVLRLPAVLTTPLAPMVAAPQPVPL